MASNEIHKYTTSEEDCFRNASHETFSGVPYCNRTWDTIVCWEPTEAGTVAKQPCPSIFSAKPESMVYKTCLKNGTWATPRLWRGFGYSNYGECVKHLEILREVFHMEEELETEKAVNVESLSAMYVVSTSILAISMLLLILSLIGLNFVLPKSIIQAAQYRVSRNLFFSVCAETVVNLTHTILVFCDNYNERIESKLSNTPVVCEIIVTAMGYTRLASTMWLFIQTHHIQLKSRSGTLCTSGFMTYCLTGWGLPIIPTTVWAVTLAVSYKVTCWPDYNSLPIVWVVHCSELLMILASFVCLVVAAGRLFRDQDAQRNSCCRRRTYYETIVFGFYFLYISVALVIMLVMKGYQSPLPATETSPWQHTSSVITNVKGTILSVLFWSFNIDFRKIVRKKIRRRTRLDLVRPNTEENGV